MLCRKQWQYCSNKFIFKCYEYFKRPLTKQRCTRNVVVVCDIDQTLGTNSADAFFYKKMDELGKKGIYGQSNVHMTYIDYTDYHYQNKFVLVEQNTPSIVRSLQAAGHKFFGLTSRSAHLALITERHLKGIGISFHSGEEYAVLLLEHPTDNPENKDFSACRNGIIHVGGNDKGETLMKFFEKMEIEPGFVLFIDDGERHVKSVVSALERKTIPCVGIVYDGAKVHPQTAAAAA